MLSPRLIHPIARPGVVGYLVLVVAAATLALAAPARADESWPRQFDSSSGSFVIYQPQPEDLHGDLLAARAAFSLQKSADATPTFGVLWFTERIEIDRDSSSVAARSLDVTKVRLPGITSADAARYEALVEDQASVWDLSGSLEELQAGLAAAEKERASVAGLDNTPPKILFHNHRAILVVYDGSPLFGQVEGADLQGAVNTPYAVIYDPQSRSYYLNGANLWYRAKDPLGPWRYIVDPPAAVRDVVPPDTSSSDQIAGPPPDVLTATEPTELIATDGAPRYAPLVEDSLLYVANTESDVILEVSTQDLYVLISGRWFRAHSTDGPWTFVRGDQLPSSFRRVPFDSPKGNILASVAGTDQAEDAIADAEIPQTSAIRRDDRTFQVAYDGDPEFDPIEGTNLEYAVNTDAEVLLADGRYYACDQGVWYIADDPDGPWSVSETRPLGLEDIPPSCPVYDVRYVDIYEATPDVVYVGYLPGYLGCYPYFGTVVYGTGYYYPPWRGRHHYYPRRSTWGFQARYNLWLNRWSFGFSYNSGFLRVGTRWRADAPAATRNRARSKWFGPGGFRRSLVAQDLTPIRERRARARTRVPDGLPANVYNRPENITRVDRSALRIRTRSIARSFKRPGAAPNDVFGGQDGRVYRRDDNGTWRVRTGSAWTPTPTPATGSTATGSTATGSTATGSTATGSTTTPTTNTRDRTSTPAPPSEPPIVRQRREPAVERQLPPREDRSERPTPRAERSSPGNLEREYRARQRSEGGARQESPPPAARSTHPSRERQEEKAPPPRDEKSRERPRDEKRDRSR